MTELDSRHSISTCLVVLIRRAFAVMIVCVALGPFASLLGADGADASGITLHVDPGASPWGDGSATAPFQRLTDALKTARQLRAAAGERTSARSPIVIEVASGDLVGSYSPQRLANNPALEPLPFVVNVPWLIIRGSTQMALDADGRPTGEVVGAPTRIVPDAPLGPGDSQIVFLITDTTDGFAGNGAAVERFVVESGQTVGRGGAGVVIIRVHDYAVRENLFGARLNQAVDSRQASGEIAANYARNVAICAICAAGPGEVRVKSNRAFDGLGGLLVSSTISHVPFDLGVQAQSLAVAPLVVRERPHFAAEVVGNDFSNHVRNASLSFGIRIMQYGLNTAQVVVDQGLTVIARKNRIRNNIFGVEADAGFPERGGPSPTGGLEAVFQGNDVGDNQRSPLLVTFTRHSTTFDCSQLPLRPYLENTSYNFHFLQGDSAQFEDIWIDHPSVDPHDQRWLDNRLRVNGRPIQAPFRYVPAAPAPCGG